MSQNEFEIKTDINTLGDIEIIQKSDLVIISRNNQGYNENMAIKLSLKEFGIIANRLGYYKKRTPK